MAKPRDRGPMPDLAAQEALARWAAACAERALAIFEHRYPGDARPRAAIDTLRACGWPSSCRRAYAFARVQQWESLEPALRPTGFPNGL